MNMAHPFQDMLLLEDAVRISGPAAFNIMLKPGGSLCNLDCHYCYYLDKADLYGGREPRMTVDMLEKVVRDYIAANDVPEVQFNWHGGEPLVMGLDFYRKAVEFQRKYADGKTVFNTLQTNGTLLDAAWADFFRENHFLVGLSLDGPKDIHDKYRKDKGGQPTFDRVMNGLRILRSREVAFNTLSTVNKASEGRGLEVYQFLKSVGSQYMQFLPVVEHVLNRKSARPHIVDPATEGAQLAFWSVSAGGFGRFMCDIFDYWVRNDVGQFYVGLFDATLANWCGVQPGTCVHSPTCGGNSVLEHNGDLYPCDHFVYPKYRLGNIGEASLRSLMESAAQVRFGIDKRNALPVKCFRCKYLHLCNGECPKHRFNRTESGETGLNALCEGYYHFFAHTAPYMQKMQALLAQELPPAYVIPWARSFSGPK